MSKQTKYILMKHTSKGWACDGDIYYSRKDVKHSLKEWQKEYPDSKFKIVEAKINECI